MRCPSCGQQVRPTAKFCGDCETTSETEGKPVPAKGHKQKGAKTPARRLVLHNLPSQHHLALSPLRLSTGRSR